MRLSAKAGDTRLCPALDSKLAISHKDNAISENSDLLKLFEQTSNSSFLEKLGIFSN